MAITFKPSRLPIILAATFALILAVLIAAMAPAISAARQQARLVAQIHGLGGEIVYDFQLHNPRQIRSTEQSRGLIRRMLGDDFASSVVEVKLSHSRVSDDDIKLLLQLPSIKRLGLYDTAITDNALRHIAQMGQLEILWLDQTKVTDQGIQKLVPLQNLKKLLIQYNSITDEAAPYLAQLHGLRHLALGSTQIGDNGVRQLAGLQLESIKLDNTPITDASGPTLAGFTQLNMLDVFETKVTDKLFDSAPSWPNLEYLRIHDTGISDKCVPALSKLKSLKVISLGTQVTDGGAAKLQQALPGCKIYR